MPLTALPWETIGPGALLTLAVILILTGRLVPRASLMDKQREADNWRQAHERSEAARQIEQQARAESQSQVSELLAHARTTQAFIAALQSHAAPLLRDRGEADS